MDTPGSAVRAGSIRGEDARRFVTAGIERCTALGRDDLAQRLVHARRRIDEPSTVLYVAGEYKQGKSMLVNALIGQDICPVDDDLSTATVTWLRHGDPAAVRVRRRVDGAPVVEDVAIDEIWRYASERGNPQNHLEVDIVDVGVPSPVLGAGVTLVDSPGAGSLQQGRSEAALSFLPYADALLFVTDASADLTVHELGFLSKAREVCPTVLVVLTKTDLYREWPRIAELDGEHLARLGLDGSTHPVSSALRVEAVRRSDASLNAETGFPRLLAAIRTEVLDEGRTGTAQRSLEDTSQACSQLLASLKAEREALTDRSAAETMLAGLAEARQRLSALRQSGSRWTTTLGDGITDLNQDVDRRLKSAMRDELERLDERLGDADPAAHWAEIGEELQVFAARLAREVLERVRTGTEDVAERVEGELHEAGLRAPHLATSDGIDLGALWDSSDRSLTAEKRQLIGTGLGALRGTSGGIVLMGVLTNLAGIAVATPVAIGVGVLFGAKHLVDERKRQIERRRQQARAAIRDYLGRVQSELGLESRRSVQESHRLLRDVFAAQITELNATLTETVRTIEGTLAASDRQRTQRGAAISQHIADLEPLIVAIDEQRKRLEAGLHD